MLTLLAVAAGCVDAISFLGLGRVLTAAMTGNTLLLGLAVGQGDVAAALRSTVALLGFVAGVMLGASILGRGPAGVMASPAVTATLALEFVVLVAIALVWHLADGTERWMENRFPLIAAAGAAMGIQSAVTYHIGVAGVATTYVTGTLTSVATHFVRWLTRRSPRAHASESSPSWLQAGVWIAYGTGAAFVGAVNVWWPRVAAGILDEVRWPFAALLLPIAIVGTVVLILGRDHRRKPTGG